MADEQRRAEDREALERYTQRKNPYGLPNWIARRSADQTKEGWARRLPLGVAAALFGLTLALVFVVVFGFFGLPPSTLLVSFVVLASLGGLYWCLGMRTYLARGEVPELTTSPVAKVVGIVQFACFGVALATEGFDLIALGVSAAAALVSIVWLWWQRYRPDEPV